MFDRDPVPMKKLACVLPLLVALGSCSRTEIVAPKIQPSAGVSAQVAAYLEEFTQLFEKHSIRRKDIDWRQFRSEISRKADSLALRIGRPFETVGGSGILILESLGMIADNHSFWRPVGGQIHRTRTFVCLGAALARPTVPSHVGYVRVEAFAGTNAQAVTFAEAIQDSIRAHDREGIVGWVVDLRGNGGGDMYPMIAGLGPILGDATLGYFIDSYDRETPWSYRDGAALIGDTVVHRVPAPYRLRHAASRVAVLTDGRTASSGEATAISFQQHAGARFFGTETCGLTSANRGFVMSDGAALVIANAHMADRKHVRFAGRIRPHEVVSDPTSAFQRAIRWLETGQ
jgi:carboxyl-terminal processing protease